MMKTISFAQIAHVGEMLREKQRHGSYEGNCLSVSIHPSAWSQIARIGLDGFIMRRVDEMAVRFLNASKLTSEEKSIVKEWATVNDLLTTVDIYEASYFDVEDEARRSFECQSHQEALDELEEMPRPKIRGPIPTITATEKLLALSNQKPGQRLSSDLSFDLALIIYARKHLDVDGVWWQERLAPERLSAPRGALFNERLSAFECYPANFADVGPCVSIEDYKFDFSPKPNF